VPAPVISDIDVTEESAVDEFMTVGDMTDDGGVVPASDDNDDMGGDDFAVSEEETNEEEVA